MGLWERLNLLLSARYSFAEVSIGMNVDDVIANSLEFVLDELCLVSVVVAEGQSRNLVPIKLLGRSSRVDSPWRIVVGTKYVHANIEILLPAVCSSQDITNLHLHILGGIC